ncbi:MAG: tetratricopeptide repeat protein [Candidatus Eisenbacteria bacterium]
MFRERTESTPARNPDRNACSGPALGGERFRRALAGYPRSPRLLASLSKCLAAQGRTEEALECVFESLTLDPGQPALLLRAADFLTLLDRCDEALRFCEHYQSLRPSSPRGYVRMGDCHLRRGNLWSAADAYFLALSRSPENRLVKSRLRGVMRLCASPRG